MLRNISYGEFYWSYTSRVMLAYSSWQPYSEVTSLPVFVRNFVGPKLFHEFSVHTAWAESLMERSIGLSTRSPGMFHPPNHLKNFDKIWYWKFTLELVRRISFWPYRFSIHEGQLYSWRISKMKNKLQHRRQKAQELRKRIGWRK